MRYQLLALVFGTAVAVPISFGADAEPNEKIKVARDLATRVGQILGAATACREIAPSRIKSMNDKLMEAFNFATSSPDDLNALKQLYDRTLAEGRRTVTSRPKECIAVDRDLANLESVIKSPPAPVPSGLTAFTGATPLATVPITPAPPPSAGTARSTVRTGTAQSTVPTVPASPDTARRAALAPVPSVPVVPTSPFALGNVNAPARGVTADEIRFGMSAPLSGPTKELGQQMKLGIEAAFNEANANGGVHGRLLRLISADDGYEPARTMETMKQLYETEQVFGVIGNVGTPTATVALPFALERKMLFYGAFTGANLLRRDPPDRYVFNYRASYAEETGAVVRYLVKQRRLRPEQIAVFAQQDAYGDAGFAGVAKAIRALRGGDEGTILRLDYKRNTVDVDDAIKRLRLSRVPIKAVVMVATYRAAAKFIEKTHDAYPGMIYTNVSFVGSTALAEELRLLGPRFANGVIVTQVVPAVESFASIVLEYKSALATYSSPAEVPDYVSLEGYLAAKVLVEALKRAGPQPDTEKVVDALENLRDFDIGLGVPVNFSRTEHQALHKVWGTQLDANGHYQPIELQ